MKYEKPSMELKWLEAREVFMSGSTTGRVEDGGTGDNSGGFVDGGSDDPNF